ncbi:hypothetical protein ACNPKP_19330 [Klebsiella pneumoniae]|uniref:hypothetical protein n=1 Tax=Klebsiella pneumoniae TaxID=573 RepID=UPI000C7C3F4E|nr:hypothetical protein [Klebsiella pneumoniae]HBQ5209298.1 hypothetical protein [Klebsiella pneumoniae]HCD8730826.1 hypothetical protein [Klebsiella pneumoniae]
MNSKDYQDVIDLCDEAINMMNSYFAGNGKMDLSLTSHVALAFMDGDKINQDVLIKIPVKKRLGFRNNILFLYRKYSYSTHPRDNSETRAILNAFDFIKSICLELLNSEAAPSNSLKVFYSWQSSTDCKFNRYFIRDCLRNAVLEVKSDMPIDELERYGEVTVDSDTNGTSGSPHIFGTILGKIDDSAIFIADISLVSPKTCNSNVLLELGYAIKTLGFSKIIMLFNTSLGELDDLPFDLRSQRITTYSYKVGDDRTKVSKHFTSVLKSAIKAAL